MIDILNNMLRYLLSKELKYLAAGHIGFDPPDEVWRRQVGQTTVRWLNLYLVELHENARLRSNERQRQLVGGQFEETAAPARLDLHYLISAWSPASFNQSPLVEAWADEYRLLYDVTQVLMHTTPLDATAIYGHGNYPADFPMDFFDPVLPAVVAPPEAFAKLPDFWMRMDWVWKPVIELIVTIPVMAITRPIGPPVTTLAADLGQNGVLGSTERVVAIGGVVWSDGVVVTPPPLKPSTPRLLPGAWVRIVETGRMITANAAGQFIFEGLTPGQFHIEAGAVNHRAVSRLVSAPSPSGQYDIHLAEER